MDEPQTTDGRNEMCASDTSVRKDQHPNGPSRAKNEHTFVIRALTENNDDEIAVEYELNEVNGTCSEQALKEAILLEPQDFPPDALDRLEDALASFRRGSQAGAWPDGGDLPITAGTFTWEAAKSAGLVDRKNRPRLAEAAEYIMDRLRFSNVQDGDPMEGQEANLRLVCYDHGIYRSGTERLIAEAVEGLLPFHARNNLVKEIIGKIERRAKVVRPDDLNLEGWRCMKNGLINVLTLEFRDFTPDMVFTKRLPVAYDPQAECPAFKKFLSEVTEKPEDIDGLLEVIGWCLEPGYEHQWITMLVGEGANGKSVYLKVLRRLLGPGLCSSVPLHDLTNPDRRFSRAELFGRSANIHEDIGAEEMKDTGELKNLSGGGNVTAERKYGHPFMFDNQAKLIFSCNHVPYTKDDTKGFNRRWRFFDYPHTFEGGNEDPSLAAKLTTEEELSGILNEALRGLQRIRETNKLSGADDSPDRYHLETNSLAVFLETYCYVPEDDDERSGHAIPKEELLRRYRCWCREKGIQAASDKKLNEAVKKKFNKEVPYPHPKVTEVRIWWKNQPRSRAWCPLVCDYEPGDAGASDAAQSQEEKVNELRTVLSRGEVTLEALSLAGRPDLFSLAARLKRDGVLIEDPRTEALKFRR